MFSIISDFALAIPLISLKFSKCASPTFVITPMWGLINFDNFPISPVLLIPTSKTPNLSWQLKFDKLIGTPKWLLNDFGEWKVFSKLLKIFLIIFFKEVLPALPVMATILAEE